MLQKIQSDLKAPKGQYNRFGKYKYRNCEDILEAVKPILAKHKAYLILSDEIVAIGDRIYVRATATLMEGKNIIATASGFAREAEVKKGMDSAQITGAASSYARKYALNGLFCIDDTKEADTTNKHDEDSDDDSISEEQFNNLFPKWEKIVKDGKQTHKQLLSFIAKKGLKLAPGHIDLINKVEVTKK